ncbi:DUF2255 family protein [Lactiplantibacillus herbarum]|uniref:DUF2255 family protein n=1 Tax=Lactiplantibacillus herbarum TaxID=1670446 RepID=UPI00064F1B76|nr:DUF2255 family protein [Lactiplantibacillus herbarum]
MNWTPEELNIIDHEESLFISIRDDQGIMHKPTYIWGVSANGDFYARGASGVDSKWYKAALLEQKGHITIGKIEKDVLLTFPHDNQTRLAIDQAYKNKYDSVIELMTSDKVAAATVKITPVQ